MPREDFSRQLQFFKSFKRITLSKPFANQAQCAGGCQVGVAATGGKLPAACAIPIFPTLLAGKRKAGVILPLVSISALPTSFFPITGLALALTPYPWRGKMGLCLHCQEAPDSLRAQAPAIPGSTSATRVGDALCVSMLMSDFVRVIAIEVCDQPKAEKKCSTQALSPTVQPQFYYSVTFITIQTISK